MAFRLRDANSREKYTWEKYFYHSRMHNGTVRFALNSHPPPSQPCTECVLFCSFCYFAFMFHERKTHIWIWLFLFSGNFRVVTLALKGPMFIEIKTEPNRVRALTTNEANAIRVREHPVAYGEGTKRPRNGDTKISCIVHSVNEFLLIWY